MLSSDTLLYSEGAYQSRWEHLSMVGAAQAPHVYKSKLATRFSYIDLWRWGCAFEMERVKDPGNGTRGLKFPDSLRLLLPQRSRSGLWTAFMGHQLWGVDRQRRIRHRISDSRNLNFIAVSNMLLIRMAVLRWRFFERHVSCCNCHSLGGGMNDCSWSCFGIPWGLSSPLSFESCTSKRSRRGQPIYEFY